MCFGLQIYVLGYFSSTSTEVLQNKANVGRICLIMFLNVLLNKLTVNLPIEIYCNFSKNPALIPETTFQFIPLFAMNAQLQPSIKALTNIWANLGFAITVAPAYLSNKIK